MNRYLILRKVTNVLPLFFDDSVSYYYSVYPA